MRSNSEWIFWGEHDPLYAVATRAGREREGSAPWTEQEIADMGRALFAAVERHWRHYGMGEEHCVEIGSGSGRLTRQLVERFRHVTAVDVSAAQHERARKLLGEHARNVTFELVDEPELPIEDASCDGVFSCEVFQHFDDSNVIAAYLREARRVLRPGATICFHLPVTGIFQASFLDSRLRNNAAKLLRRLGRRRLMVYRRYDAGQVLRLLADAGFEDPELRIFHAEQEGAAPYFFARVGSAPPAQSATG